MVEHIAQDALNAKFNISFLIQSLEAALLLLDKHRPTLKDSIHNLPTKTDITTLIQQLEELNNVSRKEGQNAMNHLEQTVSQNTSDLENVSEQGINVLTDNAFKPNYATLIEQLAKQANRGCGLSFELYSRRFRSSVNTLLERLSDDEKETVIALAEAHGYERDQPNVVQNSTPEWDEDTRYCSHGIELGCCPAGCGE